MNACSTLVALFALVSINGMPISSANALYVNQELFRSIENHYIKKTKERTEEKSLPLLYHMIQLGCQLGHTYFQPEACLRFRLHSDQFHSTIA